MAILTTFEQTALYAVVGVAVAALLYALVLRRQVVREDSGSGKIKEVWEGMMGENP
jgi:K(+)-stimulated pyrophosphate-energized sodium pump